MNWLSYHIYHNELDDLLVSIILPLLNELSVQSYFFIRFSLPHEHIRLRLLPHKSQNIFVNKAVIKFLNENKCVYKIIPYKREIERYGGEEAIEIAESEFHDSSQIVLSLVKRTTQWDYNKAFNAALLLDLTYVQSLPIEKHYKSEFCKFLYQHKQGTKAYSSHSYKPSSREIVMLNQYLSQNNENPLLRHRQSSARTHYLLLRGLETDSKLSLPPCNYLKSLSKTQKSQYVLWHILESYLHMTHNRLGIHLENEVLLYKILMTYNKYYEK